MSNLYVSRWGAGLITLLISMPAWAADSDSLTPQVGDESVPGLIRMECGRPPFPNCQTLVNELIQGREGKDSAVIGLKKVAQEIADGVYEGKVYPNGRQDSTGAVRESEPFGTPPICPAVPVALNGCKDEMKKNHKDQDCGKPFTTMYSIPPKYLSNIRNTRGSRETSHLGGVYVVALSDSYKKIEAEVLANRLSVPSGACSVQAADLKELIKKHKQMVNVNKIENCDPKAMSSHNECSAHKYFSAGFESLRAAYMILVRCRMIDESSRKHREFVNGVLARIEADTMEPCGKSCGKSDDCLISCYQGKYEQWIKNEMKSKFPKAAEGC